MMTTWWLVLARRGRIVSSMHDNTRFRFGWKRRDARVRVYERVCADQNIPRLYTLTSACDVPFLILFVLEMHDTGDGISSIAASGPAPVGVIWAGFPGSMGMPSTLQYMYVYRTCPSLAIHRCILLMFVNVFLRSQGNRQLHRSPP
jgi:hypothetical protein